MKKILFPSLMLVLIAVAVSSCKSKTASDESFEGKILNVPLLKHEKTDKPTYEGFWKSIDTIVFDNSTPESLIGRVYNVRFTDDHIFFHSQDNSLHIFDYQGNFVRKIQKVGRGRGEYDMLLKFDVQENAQLISILDGTNMMRIYTYEGVFVRQFELQQHITDFAVLPNGHYLLLNYEDERNGIRGLYETDDQGNTIRNLFELPEWYKHISFTSPYLIHLNDNTISCMGLEDDNHIYHFENDSFYVAYKITTDINVPREIMEDGSRWSNPGKEYTKIGFWETDRFLGIGLTDFNDFVQTFYDKKEDRFYRFYNDEMNDDPLLRKGPIGFQYAGNGKLAITYDPEFILQNPELKASFPKVDIDSNPILVIWQ